MVIALRFQESSDLTDLSQILSLAVASPLSRLRNLFRYLVKISIIPYSKAVSEAESVAV
jgi:hypothetical protein